MCFAGCVSWVRGGYGVLWAVGWREGGGGGGGGGGRGRGVGRKRARGQGDKTRGGGDLLAPYSRYSRSWLAEPERLLEQELGLVEVMIVEGMVAVAVVSGGQGSGKELRAWCCLG